MSRIKLSLVVLAAVALTGGNLYGENWKVGEKWTYQHQGPRPYSDGVATVKGDRTVQLTAIRGEGDQKRYLLKNQWGDNDTTPSTSHIDAKNLMHKIEIESMGVLTLNPPVPAFWALKVGEERILTSKMEFSGFILTVEYKAKRLADETITVPAGTFKNCQHVQIVSATKSDIMPPTKGKVDNWYHPKVKNLVKEVTVTNYDSDNSYTTTSTLKTHTKQD